MSNRDKVFISYSHEDMKWLNAIKEQLKVLETEGLLSMCEDTQLEVGGGHFSSRMISSFSEA